MSYPEFQYSNSLASLKELDFPNLDLRVFDEKGQPELVAELRSGIYKKNWSVEQGSDWIRLDSVDFVPSEEYAIVKLSRTSTGMSSSDFGLDQVFVLRSQHPVAVQQIKFNTRGFGASVKFNANSEVLTIKGVPGWEQCCPKTLDIVTYKFIGDGFSQTVVPRLPMPEYKPAE
jgi:hypothetical protein